MIAGLEVAVGIALITGLTLDVAAGVGMVLVVAFGVAIAVNLRRERRIPCGCHANSESEIRWRDVVRNAVLFGALAQVSLTDHHVFAVEGVGRAHVGDAAIALLMAAAVVAVALLMTTLSDARMHTRRWNQIQLT